jgi:hypothetical protein
MNKKLFFAFFGMFAFLLISCNADDGDSDDDIKLSQKTAVFNAESNSVTIKAKGDSWWLNGIFLNKVNLDLSNIDKLSKNFVFTNPEFQVERKDGKTIIITMNKNTTNSERILHIVVQSGNYFDSVVITQSK